MLCSSFQEKHFSINEGTELTTCGTAPQSILSCSPDVSSKPQLLSSRVPVLAGAAFLMTCFNDAQMMRLVGWVAAFRSQSDVDANCACLAVIILLCTAPR